MASVLSRIGTLVTNYQIIAADKSFSHLIIRLILANGKQVCCSTVRNDDKGIYTMELVKSTSVGSLDDMMACLDESSKTVSLWVSPQKADELKAIFR